MPFRLLSKPTITSLAQLRDLFFACKDKIAGRKYYVKIVIDGIVGPAPEIVEGEFIYDDLGEL